MISENYSNVDELSGSKTPIVVDSSEVNILDYFSGEEILTIKRKNKLYQYIDSLALPLGDEDIITIQTDKVSLGSYVGVIFILDYIDNPFFIERDDFVNSYMLIPSDYDINVEKEPHEIAFRINGKSTKIKESSTFRFGECAPITELDDMLAFRITQPMKLISKWGVMTCEVGDYLIYEDKETFYACSTFMFYESFVLTEGH